MQRSVVKHEDDKNVTLAGKKNRQTFVFSLQKKTNKQTMKIKKNWNKFCSLHCSAALHKTHKHT